MKITPTLLAAFAAVSSLCAAPSLHVEVSGKGDPVILIPGLSCSGEVWTQTVEHLKPTHECHVVTLPGFAGVPASAAPDNSLVAVREALATYIETHHLGKATVIGHSLGGYLALDLAATHPEQVKHLVIVDAYPFFAGVMQPGITPEGAAAMAAQMKQGMDGQSDEANRASVASGAFTRAMVTSDTDHQAIIRWGLASDRHTVSASMAEMIGRDLRPSLPNIKCPVKVMLSYAAYAPQLNRVMLEGFATMQYSGLAGVSFAIHDQARHFMMLDAPGWFNQQLDSSL